MNSFLSFFLATASCDFTDIVLSCLRVAIGIIMACHGFEKLAGGPGTWRWLGYAMGNFGIHWLPVLWGLLASCIEFFGGLLLIIGLGTRLVSLFLAGVMVVAYTMHVKKGDPFQVYSHALTLLVVFLSFMAIGSGSWSVDHLLTKNMSHLVR